MNLIEGLQKEIARNQELIKLYETFPMGHIAAALFKQDIAAAESAIACGDTVAMVRTYAALKENDA